MSFDVIRAVEACYAGIPDECAWLAGLLDALLPLDGGPGMFAQEFRIRNGRRAIECEVQSRTSDADAMAQIERLDAVAPPETIRRLYAASPPVRYTLRRLERIDPTQARTARALYRSHGVEDSLALFATGPDGRTLVVVMAVALGRRLHPPQTLHRLRSVCAHLNSSLRLRQALSRCIVDASPTSTAEAALDPRSNAADGTAGASTRQARQSLADVARRLDRAQGALRRCDPDETLGIWQGLVDGTWSLVDRHDSDGKRYVLARRNEPGVRDPKALTRRERSALALAAMGHQNKLIAYLLGVSTAAVSAHLGSAQRKLGLRSRAELIESFAGLVSHKA